MICCDMILTLSLLPSLSFICLMMLKYFFEAMMILKLKKKIWFFLKIYNNLIYFMFTLALLKCKVRLEIQFILSVDFTVSVDVTSKKATQATSFSMFHLDYTFWKYTSLMKCIPL